ncbi:TlpA disulfide reductase family protein [Chitinophaga sp.]|uniref:TlpA disulfide reductase family protein n=1 Tax=Chitinophaga sp. TaxID=1869181 RepID=UPI002BAE2BFA|nr:TlpA disulfide reductase family protein [Chitinophaga sp.]HWV68065.1 TlpA disulfide reductase family protein [Chitinophaga sp.]
MKLHTPIMFATLLAAACSQPKAPSASITAELRGLKDSVVFISIPVADSAKTDTVPVKDGHFTWTGNVTEPQKIYIGTSTRYLELFVENTAIKLDGNIDSTDQIRITGSASQDAYEAFKKSISDITSQEDALYPKFQEVKDNDSAKAALENSLEALRKQRHDRAKAYIKAHPESPVSVNMVADMAVMGEYAPVDSLYRVLTPEAQQTGAGVRLAKRLAVLKKSALGQPMIDFTQNDVDGKPVRLSDFKGKYVLLDFWASWCGPCRAENPNVLKAYNKFKDKNFTVLGVSLDDKADKWKEAIKQDGMPWMEVSDLKGWRNEVAQEYGIQGIPFSFLIDPQGVIIAKDLRGAALHTKLAEILK